MTVEATFLIENPSVSQRTARDLWAELNRVRSTATTAAERFDGVAAALKGSDPQHLRDATDAVEDVLAAARLYDLSHQLSSMPPADDDHCDQAHDPELWEVRDALLAAQRKIAGWRKATDKVAQLEAAEQAAQQLRTVADLALDVTAAAETEAALQGRSVGSAVRLVELFPQLEGHPERQKRLAERLATRAGRLAVDEQRAIVYVKSRSAAALIATYIAPLLWTALGAVVVLLPYWLDLGLTGTAGFWHGWETPLGAYVLVLAGVVAHILVTAEKERQASSGAPLPIGSPLDWLHTRWASIGLTFVWAVVVVFGIALSELTGSELGRETGLLFVFAGFSVDSVAGLFLARFDVLAKKGTQTLTEQIAARQDGHMI